MQMDMSAIVVIFSILPEIVAEMTVREAFFVYSNKTGASHFSSIQSWFACQQHCAVSCTDLSFVKEDHSLIHTFHCSLGRTDEMSSFFLSGVFVALLILIFFVVTVVLCCRWFCCKKRSDSNAPASIQNTDGMVDIGDLGVVGRQEGASV
ncbi:hypothetical protein PRIPAC_97411 [Pristionchus pacificus]|uniref:Uncharacterized protein n=1 Tax=Pristionchus pacificus TaxID=54126 RepID=A0A2A6BCY5_PRIPA|nr:hypothetical protein PRIPAC_97411 [Pristionchus pacificus]|eukprot:PDM63734.1 hypothetical protein PRIPAC_49707 [Pristionchus pacificus]